MRESLAFKNQCGSRLQMRKHGIVILVIISGAADKVDNERCLASQRPTLTRPSKEYTTCQKANVQQPDVCALERDPRINQGSAIYMLRRCWYNLDPSWIRQASRAIQYHSLWLHENPQFQESANDEALSSGVHT